MQVILKSGDSASIRTSKQEDNDEIRRILAYVYLVEHKAVSFSAFSDYQCHPPFYLIRQWPRLQLAGPGYPDSDTRWAMHVILRTASRRLSEGSTTQQKQGNSL